MVLGWQEVYNNVNWADNCMKIVMDRLKSGKKKQNTNFTLKNRLISLYFDMNTICTSVKMAIYNLWIYTGSVLQCSGWSARAENRDGVVLCTFAVVWHVLLSWKKSCSLVEMSRSAPLQWKFFELSKRRLWRPFGLWSWVR